MSESVLVLCQDTKPITCQEIIDFINDGCYFDEDVRLMNVTNKSVVIEYCVGVRPIIIHFFSELDTIDEMKEETRELVNDRMKNDRLDDWMRKNILSIVDRCQEIFLVEFAVSTELSEECWDAMASVEAFIAREKQGIIIADEGVYNEKLELIAAF